MIDDRPTVCVAVPTVPFFEPSASKGVQATLESYGAVAADADKSAAKTVANRLRSHRSSRLRCIAPVKAQVILALKSTALNRIECVA